MKTSVRQAYCPAGVRVMLEHITLHLWCSEWRTASLSCSCFIWPFRLSRIRSCVYSNNFKALNILTYFFRLHFCPRFLLVFVRLRYGYFSKFFSCTTYCSDFRNSTISGCLPKVTYFFVASYRLRFLFTEFGFISTVQFSS